MTEAVEIRGLQISYGGVPVVRGLDLRVRAGEVLSLLGPSGCGKTTTLRAVAGLIRPEGGRVLLRGEDVTERPPNRRNIGFVFQGYALFPHMTVFDNVAYGLRVRGVGRTEMEERVGRALAVVQLSHVAGRRPRQLSGGQQQRVAIARALVIEPDVLLLDEPLSNLDAKLRGEMRVELRRLLKAADIASIFVTHDQEEAMTLSDTVVVMNDGRIEQAGPPREVYHRPASLFIASFLGGANLLRGVVAGPAVDGTVTVTVEGERLAGVACGPVAAGAAAVLLVRHDRVRPGAAPDGNQVTAAFDTSTFAGGHVQLQLRLGAHSLSCTLPGDIDLALEPGQALPLHWAVADTLVFPAEGV